MPLSAAHYEQFEFTKDVCRLIEYCRLSGYAVSFGEAWRPQVTQDYYFEHGMSDAKDGGQHGKRLAIDLNFFDMDSNKWLVTEEELRPIGEEWVSLNPEKNRWGGRFKSFKGDYCHFERYA